MGGTGSTPPAAATRPSFVLMIATYVAGGIGLFIGFGTVGDDDLTLACLLSVGVVGILSFVRHSLFHRSDAARMGWDLGRRNNFQIEVGLANLAWGVVAVLAVALDWGLAVESAMFLVIGAYITSVSAMEVFFSGGEHRKTGVVVVTAAFGVMLLVLGAMGMSAAT